MKNKLRMRLMVGADRYAELARDLTERDIELDDGADLLLSERGVCPSFLSGRRGGELFRIPVGDISRIESFAHDIVAYTPEGEFRLSEPLKRLAVTLDPAEFLRVSNSVIVSVSHIKSIRPAVTQKFILTMKDGARVDVTRTYYYIFKEFIGL